MKAVIQRVNNASVEVEGQLIGKIGKGLVVLVGFEKEDVEKIDEKIKYVGQKIVNLRIFEDSSGKMNLSVKDIKGELLVVSNFTLAGSVKRVGGHLLTMRLAEKKPENFTRNLLIF